MFEIGRIQNLKVHRLDEQGAWLGEESQPVLLPIREVPADARVGAVYPVFVTLDSAEKPVATLHLPKAQVGEFAVLKVKDVTRHGAFLDWGMPKDLLVPYSEQPERMRAGHKYLVKVCLDNRGRVVGTARLDECLEPEIRDLKEGDRVELILWQYTDLGAKVIVNGLYGALLYKDELRSGLKRGDRLPGYVKTLRPDGKLDVTLRQSGVEGIEEARNTLLAALQKEGFLPLHDKSPSWEIQKRLGMSKKVFKKAVGGLYKEKRVELSDDGVRLKSN